MFLTSEIRDYAADNLRFPRISNSDLFQQIMLQLPAALKAHHVPAIVREDRIKSGGFFGTVAPMLLIKHPSPPASFFDIGIVINDNIVSFPLLGKSDQYAKIRLKKFYEREGQYSRASVIRVDQFLIEQEDSWRQAVLEAFDSMTTAIEGSV